MLLLAWNASNLAGHSKKVVVNSMTLSLEHLIVVSLPVVMYVYGTRCGKERTGLGI